VGVHGTEFHPEVWGAEPRSGGAGGTVPVWCGIRSETVTFTAVVDPGP
jgi:hypothetical protein